MSRIARTLTLNTIFSKIAVVLVVCVGAVSGAITLVQGHFADRLTREFVARMADSNSQLVGDVVAGAVKFGKSDQVVEMFEATIKHSEDQIAAMIAVGGDQTAVAEVVGENVDREFLMDLARRAMTQEQVVSSPDGLVVAVPLRFGATRAVVGAVANSWTPDLFLARFAQAGRYAIAVAGAVFLVAVLMAVVVMHRALVRPLTACRTAILALSRAQYDAPIPGRGRGDEIGQIARAVEVLRDQLAASALVQRHSDVVSSAFTGSSAAMMIIDETMTISCVNPCMTALFTRHGDVIRRSVGDFDAESMVGQTVDILRQDKADIRRMINRSGGATIQAIVPFGDVRLSLGINAVTLADGTPAGHVLEWSDVTKLSMDSAVLDAIETDQIKAEFDIDGRFVSAYFVEKLLLDRQVDC